ncbi:MAG: DoxX family protein [Gracilimonas sp.]|uniref:DoxX family protein n=1 Tax=Gracilimonas sediminicola TaxID=2952158 RepID=A0A9X2L2W7_9BACT|nr:MULTISPECIES: DoxX family protein [Gracilimonas]MBO6584832.1 DoxX family protein [Gracilimonas sp.]MBO6615897.1 DoxX family protein [Gracilimonas sp.]MCP9291262.1 DoxX family protein [Gracilimonas sediminicola]
MSFLFEPSFHRYLIGVLFILAGLLHFLKPGMYMSIMPDYIPFHKAMVLISGVAEILGGIGIMVPEFRTFAAWGLIVLLLVVFPANIDMAWSGYKNHGLTLYTWALIARLPLQFVLIWWVYWAGVN